MREEMSPSVTWFQISLAGTMTYLSAALLYVTLSIIAGQDVVGSLG